MWPNVGLSWEGQLVALLPSPASFEIQHEDSLLFCPGGYERLPSTFAIAAYSSMMPMAPHVLSSRRTFQSLPHTSRLPMPGRSEATRTPRDSTSWGRRLRRTLQLIRVPSRRLHVGRTARRTCQLVAERTPGQSKVQE